MWSTWLASKTATFTTLENAKIQFSSALLRSRSFKKFNFRQHYRVRDCLKIQEFRNSMLTVVLVVGVVVDVVGVVVDVVGV